MKQILLRVHHSLCIQFFEGKGYNDEFVRGMRNIIDHLEIYDPEIILTDRCDEICSFCPNRRNGICVTEEKVHCIDMNCLREYRLNINDVMKWKELKEIANNTIINKNKLDKICGNCQWYEICSKADTA